MTTEGKLIFSYLCTTLADVTNGTKKAPWYFNETFLEVFVKNLNAYTSFFTTLNSPSKEAREVNATHPNGFYNVFYLASDQTNYLNNR